MLDTSIVSEILGEALIYGRLSSSPVSLFAAFLSSTTPHFSFSMAPNDKDGSLMAAEEHNIRTSSPVKYSFLEKPAPVLVLEPATSGNVYLTGWRLQLLSLRSASEVLKFCAAADHHLEPLAMHAPRQYRGVNHRHLLDINHE